MKERILFRLLVNGQVEGIGTMRQMANQLNKHWKGKRDVTRIVPVERL
jgi:hypothetical protein